MEKNAFHSDLTAAVGATRPKSFANKKRKKRVQKTQQSGRSTAEVLETGKQKYYARK